MTLRINRKHMSPPPGYSFPIGDSVLVDDTVDGLIAKVIQYRNNNATPVGDPENDIAVFLQKTSPWMVYSITQDSDGDDGSDEELLRGYVNDMWKCMPLERPEHNVVKDRFTQCESCIHYRKQFADDEVCRKVIVMSPVVSGIVKSRVQYGFCNHHLWSCAVACSIKDPSAMANPKQYGGCWIKPVLTGR